MFQVEQSRDAACCPAIATLPPSRLVMAEAWGSVVLKSRPRGAALRQSKQQTFAPHQP